MQNFMEYNCERIWTFGFEWFWCCLCLVHGRRMVRLTNYAYTIEGWENNYATKNINLHSYVINIHNFDLIPVRVLHVNLVVSSSLWKWRFLYSYERYSFATTLHWVEFCATHEFPILIVLLWSRQVTYLVSHFL
jgi:hypothetical protein